MNDLIERARNLTGPRPTTAHETLRYLRRKREMEALSKEAARRLAKGRL